jgi:hypothetical protein
MPNNYLPIFQREQGPKADTRRCLDDPPGAASAPYRSCLLATVAERKRLDPAATRPRPLRPRLPRRSGHRRDHRVGPDPPARPREGLVMVPVDGPEQVVPLDRLREADREAGGPASTPEGAVSSSRRRPSPWCHHRRGRRDSLKVLSPTLGDLDIPLEGLLGRS